MIELSLIREQPDFVKQQLLRLQDEAAASRIDEILRLDKERRGLMAQSEALQANRPR
jgi:seryl-tRNA synthetase